MAEDIHKNSRIVITGAAGFIGSRLVKNLVDRGYTRIRILARPGSSVDPELEAQVDDVVRGNLLDSELCHRLVEEADVIFHLAAQRGEKSIPETVLNTVVATDRLMKACVAKCPKARIVHLSSFAVYDNGARTKPILDETCPVDNRPELRGDAYAYGKVEQEKLIQEYLDRHNLDVVILRPGAVYGERNPGLTSRVGIGTFGIFVHMGGGNEIPLTYVDNCADAIALAGIRSSVRARVLNVVDSDPPTSRELLSAYRANVKAFPYIEAPKCVSWSFCALWEWYSRYSKRQLPNAYNRRMWQSAWRPTRFSNLALRQAIEWKQPVPTRVGLERYFESERTRLA